VVPLAGPDGARAGTALTCQRVYFAAGRGLCLGNNILGGFVSKYGAYAFDDSYTPTSTFEQMGTPSRVRVSPDGRIGVTTAFITGHSYADTGFSTSTNLLDLRTGQPIGNLEEFEVTRNGSRFEAPDFNFWGVTFAADSNRFYATLRSGGQHYLVEGNIRQQTMRVVSQDVECPSLSPDNTRIAFKRRVGSAGWQLYVRDLASGNEQPLSAESRSVDDQVEWLDNGHILYGVTDDGPPQSTATSVWALAVDGSSPPTLFLPQGYSPAVVREQ
jgi:dipeptidyl aminopeptidase/acylaminoacyl peptidase